MKYLVPVFTLAILSGCAFKQTESSAGSGSGSANTQETRPREVSGDLKVSYSTDGKMVSRRRALLKNSSTDRAVSVIPLPILSPDVLRIESSWKNEGVASSELSAEVFIKSAVSGAQSLKLTMRDFIFDPSASRISLEIADLAKYFSTQEESKGTLTIILSSLRSPIGEIEFTLSTPPSRISGEGVTTLEAESLFPDLREQLRTIEAEGLQSEKLKLDLLSLVRVNDLSDSPVEAAFPVKLLGRVWQQLDSYAPKANGCRWDRGEQHSSDTLSGDVYLLPIEPDLSSTFVEKLKTARKQNVQTISIDAGKVKLIGLFAQGSRIASRPKSHASPISVSTCYPTCVQGFRPIGDACTRLYAGDWTAADECQRFSETRPDLQICGQWGLGHASMSLRTGTDTATFLDLDPGQIAAAVSFQQQEVEPIESRRINVLKTSTQID